MPLHTCLRKLATGSPRKTIRRQPSKKSFQRFLELLEDRLSPAVLHWVGTSTFNPYTPGLAGDYFTTGDSAAAIQPATVANASWIGNRTPDESHVLTGPISFN